MSDLEKKARAPSGSEYEGLLENYRNAWHGLRMIREVVEKLGPPGALVSADGVLREYGPEPIHEAQAIVDALTTILNEMTPAPVCDEHVQRARELIRDPKRQ